MAESLAKREKANAKTALDKAALDALKAAAGTPGPSSYAAAAAVGTSPPPAAAPSTEAEERQRAFAAAAAVAAAESDRSNYAQVFEGALRSFGFAALHALERHRTAASPPSICRWRRCLGLRRLHVDALHCASETSPCSAPLPIALSASASTLPTASLVLRPSALL